MAAEFSWRFLEQPVRHGALGRMRDALRALRDRQRRTRPAHARPHVGQLRGRRRAGAVVPRRRRPPVRRDRDRRRHPSALAIPAPAPTPRWYARSAPRRRLTRRATSGRALTAPAPSTPVAPNARLTVTAWGDSVMLGARYGAGVRHPRGVRRRRRRPAGGSLPVRHGAAAPDRGARAQGRHPRR